MAAKFDLDSVLTASALERALSAGQLPASGEIPVAEFTRLVASCHRAQDPVQWAFGPDASGPGPGHPRRRWWLAAGVRLACVCERCLEPVALVLESRRGFEFFESASLADARTEQMTAEDEARDPDLPMVDFLAPEDSASLRGLIEDELLLELPMAPKHADCQTPLTVESNTGDRIRPFAGLAELLHRPSKGKNAL